jgi:hypothetical protein
MDTLLGELGVFTVVCRLINLKSDFSESHIRSNDVDILQRLHPPGTRPPFQDMWEIPECYE